MFEIRREEPRDHGAVRRLNQVAFDSPMEATLVDRLRDRCEDFLAFVAVDDDTVVGHIVFSPATIDGCDAVGMGLAPMAVLPAHQRKGIGSQLVQHGLEHLRRSDCPFVIVLGHPQYYPRFGFERASRFGLRSQWTDIPDEAFMAIVLDPGAVPEKGGTARYRDEFDEAM